MTDREKICREFHEACGGHWHEWKHYSIGCGEYACDCGATILEGDNPQYLHPEEVLRAMIKRKDWRSFDLILQHGEEPCRNKLSLNDVAKNIYSYILVPDKLLIAAHKWVMERKVAR